MGGPRRIPEIIIFVPCIAPSGFNYIRVPFLAHVQGPGVFVRCDFAMFVAGRNRQSAALNVVVNFQLCTPEGSNSQGVDGTRGY